MKLNVVAMLLLAFLLCCQAISSAQTQPLERIETGRFIDLQLLYAITGGDSGVELPEPVAVAAAGSRVWIFDQQRQEPLLFEASGRFIDAPFTDEQKILGTVRGLDADKDRLLISTYSNYYIYRGGLLEFVSKKRGDTEAALYQNSLLHLSLGKDKFSQGLLGIVAMENGFSRMYCADEPQPAFSLYFPQVFGISAENGFLAAVPDSYNGFILIDLKNRTTKLIEIDIKEFRDRFHLYRQRLENSDYNIYYSVHSFLDIKLLDGRVYLLANISSSVTILETSLSGEILQVYRYEKDEDLAQGVAVMDVSRVDGRLHFFVLTNGTLDEAAPPAGVYVFTPRQ